jgi:hypothetical protein
LVEAVTQYAVPVSDVSLGSWTEGVGDGNATAFEELDEGIFSSAYDGDATYWKSTTSRDKIRCKLGAVTDPTTDSSHKFSIVARRTSGNGTVLFRLYQGSTLISSGSYITTTGYSTGTKTLSGAEADSITDYSDLRIEVEAPFGTTEDRLTAMEFECPEVAAGDGSGGGSTAILGGLLLRRRRRRR